MPVVGRDLPEYYAFLDPVSRRLEHMIYNRRAFDARAAEFIYRR